MYFADGRLYGERMKQYPYEGLVVTVGTAAIIIPLGMWLKAKSNEWPLPVFALFGIAAISGLLLIARIVDKRDADRRKRENPQSPWPVLDLPPSEFRNSSSPEKRGSPERQDV